METQIKYQYLIRALKTISACKSEAQIESAIIFKDVVLKTLFPNHMLDFKDRLGYNHWEGYLMKELNLKAMAVCGLLDEED